MARSADTAAEQAAKDAAKAQAVAQKEAEAKAKAEAAAAEQAAKDAAPDAPKVDGDRKARFAAFLADAEEQRRKDGTLAIFLAQKERGEFDVIPDSFV